MSLSDRRDRLVVKKEEWRESTLHEGLLLQRFWGRMPYRSPTGAKTSTNRLLREGILKAAFTSALRRQYPLTENTSRRDLVIWYSWSLIFQSYSPGVATQLVFCYFYHTIKSCWVVQIFISISFQFVTTSSAKWNQITSLTDTYNTCVFFFN